MIAVCVWGTTRPVALGTQTAIMICDGRSRTSGRPRRSAGTATARRWVPLSCSVMPRRAVACLALISTDSAVEPMNGAWLRSMISCCGRVARTSRSWSCRRGPVSMSTSPATWIIKTTSSSRCTKTERSSPASMPASIKASGPRETKAETAGMRLLQSREPLVLRRRLPSASGWESEPHCPADPPG